MQSAACRLGRQRAAAGALDNRSTLHAGFQQLSSAIPGARGGGTAWDSERVSSCRGRQTADRQMFEAAEWIATAIEEGRCNSSSGFFDGHVYSASPANSIGRPPIEYVSSGPRSSRAQLGDHEGGVALLGRWRPGHRAAPGAHVAMDRVGSRGGAAGRAWPLGGVCPSSPPAPSRPLLVLHGAARWWPQPPAAAAQAVHSGPHRAGAATAPVRPCTCLTGHSMPACSLLLSTPSCPQAGHELLLLCESDAGARQVLRQAFPGVRIHEDVTSLERLPEVGRMGGVGW